MKTISEEKINQIKNLYDERLSNSKYIYYKLKYKDKLAESV